MSSFELLNALLEENKRNNASPLSTVESGSDTYIIYGFIQSGSVTGYPVKKITTSGNDTFITKGFLLETSRKNGANGSTANVSLTSDATNTILLVTDPSISYG